MQTTTVTMRVCAHANRPHSGRQPDDAHQPDTTPRPDDAHRPPHRHQRHGHPLPRPRRPRGVQLAVLTVIAALLLAIMPPAAPAQAALVIVNRLDDPDPATVSCPANCTLRKAIEVAGSGDTIQFSVTGTILLNGTLSLTKNVNVQGPGAANLILDGQDTNAVINVSGFIQVSVSGLTVQRGRGVLAGGFSNPQGTLSLLNVVVKDNRGEQAGGIYNNGQLTVTNSTITNNRADLSVAHFPGFGDGGGIAAVLGSVTISGSTISNNAARTTFSSGGGVAVTSATLQIDRSAISGNTAVNGAGLSVNSGSLTLTNSTISGNTASGAGGGLLIQDGGTASLKHATLSGNSAPEGGGFWGGAGITLRNSIVVHSPSGGNCQSAITSAGNNLSDTASCFSGGAQGDVVNATPLLGPLATNSPGATQTHALLYGSPAIDGVTHAATDCPATIVTDQRGVARPQTWAGARCDIGAFELESNTAPSISNPGDQLVSEDGPYPALLITVSDAETPGSLTVTANSSNQALLPNTNIAVGASGFLRSVTFSTLPNQHGAATVTLTASDGFTTTSAAFSVTVLPVNDAPTATNDAYTVNTTQQLSVPAASGVLANDTDIDGPSLTAALVQGPSHGALTFQPDGSFTYQPAGTYTGQDSFTYRASDGAATSNIATASIKVNPLPCAPRPRVQTRAAVGGGKLLVEVASSPITDQQPSILRKLLFGEFQNARVVVNGQTMAKGQEFIVPGNATRIEFSVERLTPGQPTTVPLTVVDDCGSWPTFVGGGASAGF